MATRYPSDNDSHSRTQQGVNRGDRTSHPATRQGAAGRTTSARSGSASRGSYSGGGKPSGQRSSQQRSNQRPAPRSSGGSRGRGGRKRSPNRVPIFVALAAVLVVVVVLVVVKPFGRKVDNPVMDVAAVPASDPAPGDAAPAAAEADIDRPVQSITDVSAYIDDYVILDTTVAGVRVIARQIFKEDCEYLMVAGFDEAGSQLWMQETMTGDITELMQTDCFIAGTADAPLVMVYNAWTGLMAYNPATGENVWNVLKEDVSLGASVSYAVGNDGTIYIGGYYGPDPVAIDANGTVLWQSDSGDAQANWLYEIQLVDQGVGGHYSMLSGDRSGWVAYNYDGTVNQLVYD